MQFFDRVNITVQSGKGGDGAATGRREKYIAYGGPSGGDGGSGGSVFLRATPHQRTLLPYRYRQLYKAGNGEPGKSKDQFGLSGEDLSLDVPVGTTVYDKLSGTVIASLDTAGDTICVAQGGRGGAGNKHFISPQKQFSTIALLGEPGQTIELTLELQLIADVALIGEPSVGKSTLINHVSNVKAKTAEYHFTTLVPNLGVVEHHAKDFIMIDIPGLIEDAHTGKGLGNEFLRHILKAKLFVFLLDISRFEEGMGVFQKLMNEIQLYAENVCANRLLTESQHWDHEIVFSDTGLVYYLLLHDDNKPERDIVMKKHVVIAVTKGDLVLDEEIRHEYLQTLANQLSGYFHESYELSISPKALATSIPILSGATGEGIEGFLNTVVNHLSGEDIPNFVPHLVHTDSPHEDGFSIADISTEELEMLFEEGYVHPDKATTCHVREIDHKDIAYFTYVLPWGNDEAELRYWRILEREGHMKWLESNGVKKGDILKVLSPYKQFDEKYILRE